MDSKWITIALIYVVVMVTPGSDGVLMPLAVRLPLGGVVAPPGAPWPIPQTWMKSSTLKTLHPDRFTFHNSVSGCDILDENLDRYKTLINLDTQGQLESGLPELRGIRIIISDPTCSADYYPVYGMDESYSVNVTSANEATLEAKTIWGVVRGLETFSQLIYLTNNKMYRINETTIQDFPRFAYRGLHVDTARHFMPLPVLLRILDAMSWDKFNVFHWHVTDDQSFPYPSRTFPNLTELGSYSQYHRYSRDDVNSILAEARLRGIRVIPEFDTPGHTWSWGKALPLLLTPCYGNGTEGEPYVPDWGVHGPAEILNPMEEYTYDVLKTIFDEIIQDFPDSYVHLGMDEVYYACW